MTSTADLRKWRFWVENFDDDTLYVGADGNPDPDELAPPFVGTFAQAAHEADRRCDLYEARPSSFTVAKVVYESVGRVETAGA